MGVFEDALNFVHGLSSARYLTRYVLYLGEVLVVTGNARHRRFLRTRDIRALVTAIVCPSKHPRICKEQPKVFI